MGFFEDFLEKIDDVVESVDEGCRNFKRNMRDELGIQLSDDEIVKEFNEDRARERAHEVRERNKYLGRGSEDPIIINTGNLIRTMDDIMPCCPVYCTLGPFEHSGIYVGNHQVVELNSEGDIKKVSLKTFTNSITTINQCVYVPFKKTAWYDYSSMVASYSLQKRALAMVGEHRNYNFILDNCHQFTAGCITGDFENAINFMAMLKDLVQNEMNDGNDVEWAAWNWYDKILFKGK